MRGADISSSNAWTAYLGVILLGAANCVIFSASSTFACFGF